MARLVDLLGRARVDVAAAEILVRFRTGTGGVNKTSLATGPASGERESDPRGSPSSGVPMLLCGGEGDRHQNCRGNAARNPMPAHSRTRASPLIAVWTARAVNLDARPANSRVDANNTVRST